MTFFVSFWLRHNFSVLRDSFQKHYFLLNITDFSFYNEFTDVQFPFLVKIFIDLLFFLNK